MTERPDCSRMKMMKSLAMPCSAVYTVLQRYSNYLTNKESYVITIYPTLSDITKVCIITETKTKNETKRNEFQRRMFSSIINVIPQETFKSKIVNLNIHACTCIEQCADLPKPKDMEIFSHRVFALSLLRVKSEGAIIEIKLALTGFHTKTKMKEAHSKFYLCRNNT